MEERNKSFADICLERAEKASPGPWQTEEKIWSNQYADDVYFKYKIVTDKKGKRIVDGEHGENDDREFISHARTDLPEVCRRLKRACEALRHECSKEKYCDGPYKCNLCSVADELEAMPDGDKK